MTKAELRNVTVLLHDCRSYRIVSRPVVLVTLWKYQGRMLMLPLLLLLFLVWVSNKAWNYERYYLTVRLAEFANGKAYSSRSYSHGSRRDKIINLCVYLVQKFSSKRDNENFNDFLRMLVSLSTCRVCAFGVDGGGRLERSQRSPEKSRLLTKGRFHPFLLFS